jgi:hypothetical protein
MSTTMNPASSSQLTHLVCLTCFRRVEFDGRPRPAFGPVRDVFRRVAFAGTSGKRRCHIWKYPFIFMVRQPPSSGQPVLPDSAQPVGRWFLGIDLP